MKTGCYEKGVLMRRVLLRRGAEQLLGLTFAYCVPSPQLPPLSPGPCRWQRHPVSISQGLLFLDTLLVPSISLRLLQTRGCLTFLCAYIKLASFQKQWSLDLPITLFSPTLLQGKFLAFCFCLGSESSDPPRAGCTALDHPVGVPMPTLWGTSPSPLLISTSLLAAPQSHPSEVYTGLKRKPQAHRRSSPPSRAVRSFTKSRHRDIHPGGRRACLSWEQLQYEYSKPSTYERSSCELSKMQMCVPAPVCYNAVLFSTR